MKKTCTKGLLIVFISFLNISVFAQSTSKITINGSVVNESGIALPSANVIEKGTSNAAITDFDGNFSINVLPNATLIFSYIGMEKLELRIKDNSFLEVVLRENVQELDQVVVVGYGTQKKEEITGSVVSVQGSEIEDLPVGSLGTALVGRVLGVSVSGGESRPGQSAQITIRNPVVGNNIRAKDSYSTEPLYVIDGVVQIDPNTGYTDPTLFNSLDASQIESISFLKDASAAIYGSRSAQGVVLVTTKRGKKGPAKFSYSGNFSVADETYRHNMLNAYDFAKVFNIMNGLNGAGRAYDPTDIAPDTRYFFSPAEMEHFKTNSYNALDDYWKAAATQRHNLNVTGGSDDATYFGGISQYGQEGNLGTLDFNRWSFRAGSSINLSKGFKANFQVAGYFTDESKTTSKIGSENQENDFRQLQNRAPFLPMYINGLPAIQIGSSGNDALVGYHFGEIQRLQNLAKSIGNNVSYNINLEYDVPFINGLKIAANYSRQESSNRADQVGSRFELYEFYGADEDLTDNEPNFTSTPGNTYILYENGSGPRGTNLIRIENEIVNGDRLLIDNNRSGTEQMRFQATFNKDFGKHSVSSLFAVEKSERFENRDRVIKYGVPDWSDGMIWQTTGGFDTQNTFNWKSESGDLGYIGRLNYNYDQTYFAEFLFRSDASAKFAPENYWGNFYSLSGGWIISNENFFNSNTIDFLKLRASIGYVGKDDARAWQWRQNFDIQIGDGAVFGNNASVSSGLSPDRIANPDIKWGKESKFNIGVDARFLDDRLSTTFETFYNKGDELLVNLNSGVPFSVGGASASINYGIADTWGSEFAIGWSDTIGQDFSYAISFNLGWYQNNIKQGNFSNERYWRPWETNQPGSSDRGVWGYDYLGMFKSQADIDKYLAETGVTQILGISSSDLRPGMLFYRDVRGDWDPETKTFGPKDGIINENDQIQLQKPARGPQGFSSPIRLKYKQLSLNTVLTVNWGGYREVGSAKTPLDSDLITGNYQNRPAFWGNMYDEQLNPTGTIPNLARSINGGIGSSDGGINTVSSRFWQVSSFSLVMRNINLSYSLPDKITEKLGIRSFRLNLVGINPFILFNPYKEYGLSPYGGYNSYPVLRTYSLGVNVGF